ncbi:hypothetical protein N7530_010536 [Penicillium desertorum]|uniref:Uncharacterized protein n=1 Tax=Penicillium desertorum TaxID=1303715 RepID=A0A9W9WHS3_9EURO|nr:hypothetical protein N7530_010536 [Penicillium desertorum]
MAVSGGVYPMDHAMGYPAGTIPIVSGHSIADVQAGEPDEPGEPGEPGNLVKLGGDLRVSPVLAAHEAIQS